MLQLTKIKESIQSLAGIALNHRKLEAASKERIAAALAAVETAPRPKVVLFGVSQAGKSTLLATLMRGEQIIPIGVGTATTVVPTELWTVASAGEERAALIWKSPREVLAAMVAVVRPHLRLDPQEDAAPAGSPEQLSGQVALDVIDLANAQDRAELLQALEVAEAEARQSPWDHEPGQNDEALVIARALLTYYETYEREYRAGEVDIPLSEVHAWLRRPVDWMERDEFNPQRPFPYSYDEVKCFYVKRAQLFVRCVEGLEGVSFVDAPGYGVTPSDNAVLDHEARQADSVVLVLGSQGSQITEAQLTQVGQLSKNLTRNPFVLWNAQGISQVQAERILTSDLKAMRRVITLDIPPSRAIVANFLLALRATQLVRFEHLHAMSLGSLADEAVLKGFSREAATPEPDYVRSFLADTLRLGYETFPTKRYDGAGDRQYEAALTAANLHKHLTAIINMITQTHEAILLRDCAKEVISVLRQFLFTHPTQERFDDLNRQYEELELAIPRFEQEVGAQQKKFVAKLKGQSDELKSELVETLWAHSHYRNVKAAIKTQIGRTSSRTYVPSILRRNLRELTNARLQMWLQQVQQGESNRLRNHLLSSYQQVWLALREQLRPVSEDAQGGLQLPDWSAPKFDLVEFKITLKEELEAAVEGEFPDSMVKGFVRAYEELKVDAIKGARNKLNTFKGWLKKKGVNVKVKKSPPPHPFNREAAQAAISEQVEGFYQSWKDVLPDDLTWAMAHKAFELGLKQAFDLNSKTYSDILKQRLAELYKLKHNGLAPLSTGERAYFEQLINRLEPSLAATEQLLRPTS
jgi:uncharacterized protein YdcH (DUF465 family)